MMQDVTRETAPHAFVKAVHGVRYQVKDVARSTAFYTQYLGFTLKHQQLPAFANVALGCRRCRSASQWSRQSRRWAAS